MCAPTLRPYVTFLAPLPSSAPPSTSCTLPYPPISHLPLSRIPSKDLTILAPFPRSQNSGPRILSTLPQFLHLSSFSHAALVSQHSCHHHDPSGSKNRSLSTYIFTITIIILKKNCLDKKITSLIPQHPRADVTEEYQRQLRGLDYIFISGEMSILGRQPTRLHAT